MGDTEPPERAGPAVPRFQVGKTVLLARRDEVGVHQRPIRHCGNRTCHGQPSALVVSSGDRAGLLDVVIERTGDHAAMLRRRAQDGDATFRRMVADGHADVWEAGSTQVRYHRELWLRLLDECV